MKTIRKKYRYELLVTAENEMDAENKKIALEILSEDLEIKKKEERTMESNSDFIVTEKEKQFILFVRNIEKSFGVELFDKLIKNV